jgi:lipopolysaccharide export LptBFGC system permease protein LptF
LSGIGVAIVVGVVLFAVLAIFTTLGETEMIPTLVAAWSPNLLFALLSMYLFLGVRS